MTRVVDRTFDRAKELGMSDADLARAIGESQQTVHQWKVRGNVPARKLQAIATALMVSTDWLLSGQERTNGTLDHLYATAHDDIRIAVRLLLLRSQQDTAEARKVARAIMSFLSS